MATESDLPSRTKPAMGKDLADALLDVQVPNVVKLSPNSQQIVYATAYCWSHRTGEHVHSTIWLAETGKPKSARKLTSGEYHDRDPRWSPDGKHIAFVSDRATRSKSCAIYLLPLEPAGGEAYAITPELHEQKITHFGFSPDRNSIAYIAADEQSDEQRVREEAKDDAHVWGEWEFGRLHLVNLETKTISKLVEQDAHVTELAWSDSGSELAFSTTETTDTDSRYDGTTISTVDVRGLSVTTLTKFHNVATDLIWVRDGIYFRGAAAGGASTVSSSVVYKIDVTGADKTAIHYAQGEEDCAAGLAKTGGELIVYVLRGVQDQLQVARSHTLFSRPQAFTAWDASFTSDSDEVVIAVATGNVNQPAEVFSTTASGGALVQLSKHGELAGWAGRKIGSCQMLTCQSTDKTVTLDGVWLAPASAADESKPSPTVVLVHGGPYGRCTDSFQNVYFAVAPLLLAHGYHVLLPNYRGSSGRGEAFAAYARQSGDVDYDDVIALTQHAIEQKLADKDHLMIGGYSQGGYMSFLAAVRNGLHGFGWKFRAAIPAAGVSDQDTLIFNSRESRYAEHIAGSAPWRIEKQDTSNRKGSAIWEVHNAVRRGGVIPPMLMLHGEADTVVPISHSSAMRRALKDHGLPFEMVTYPREDHIFQERKHLVDMGVRVLRFVEKHI